MRGCSSPMTRAVSSRISFPESVTGPGMSNHALAVERQVERPHQRDHDVVDRDRLRARLQPPRQDHDRQAGGQIADDEPAQAAVPDDHARPQLDGLDRAGTQRLAHVEPAAQVLGARAGRGDAAEIHDAFDAGRGGRLREGRGRHRPRAGGSPRPRRSRAPGRAPPGTRRARGRTRPDPPRRPRPSRARARAAGPVPRLASGTARATRSQRAPVGRRRRRTPSRRSGGAIALAWSSPSSPRGLGVEPEVAHPRDHRRSRPSSGAAAARSPREWPPSRGRCRARRGAAGRRARSRPRRGRGRGRRGTGRRGRARPAGARAASGRRRTARRARGGSGPVTCPRVHPPRCCRAHSRSVRGRMPQRVSSDGDVGGVAHALEPLEHRREVLAVLPHGLDRDGLERDRPADDLARPRPPPRASSRRRPRGPSRAASTSPGSRNACAANRPMSSAAIICSFVVGRIAVTSLSPCRNQGVTRFSMKNTGRRMTCDGNLSSRTVCSTRALLSKCGMPVRRCAEPTDV